MNEEKVEVVDITQENKKKKTLGRKIIDILEVITFGLLCIMTFIYTIIGIGYVRQQYDDSIKNKDSVNYKVGDINDFTAIDDKFVNNTWY